MHRFAPLFVTLCALCLVFTSRGAGTDAKEKAKDDLAGKSLDKLMREAKSVDPAIRDNAVRTIGLFGAEGKSAVPILAALLGDLDPGVAASALGSLRAICTEKELTDIKGGVPAIIRILKFGTTAGKVNAAMALGEMGTEAKTAIKPLLELTVQSSSWEVRKAGAYALGRVAAETKTALDQNVVNALIKLLKDDYCAQVRLQAIQAIASLGAHRTESEKQYHVIKRAVEGTIAKNRDAAELVWAHTLLSQTVGVKPDAHMGSVTVMLKSEDPVIRANAIHAIGVMCSVPKDVLAKDFPRAVVDKLFLQMIETLKDRDDGVASAAALALATAKENLDTKYVARIVQLIDDEKQTSHTRVHATQALGLLGDKAVKHVNRLLALLEDQDLEVSSMAGKSLAHLGRSKGLLKVAELRAIAMVMTNPKSSRQARVHAAGCLALIGEHATAFIPDLLATLTDTDDLVAAEAARSIAGMRFYLKEDPHVAAIAALLGHNNPTVRARAVQLLAVLDEKSKPHLKDIIKALKDPDPSVVVNVIAALSQMGQSMENLEDVEAALKSMRAHPDKNVQTTTLQALGVLTKFRQAFEKP